MDKNIIIGILAVVLIVVSVGFFAFQEGEEVLIQIGEDIMEGESEEDVTEIVYWQKDARYFYEIELLEIVLENTVDEYGPYLLKPTEVDMTGDRAIVLLEAGEVIDISFHSVNLEREERLLPIKIPLLRGLLGYRVFLIRDIFAPVFEKVETLDELTEFIAGFGAQWGDMHILEANNINVRGITEYKTIFEELDSGKVDYFPRGINEVWAEVEIFKDKYPDIVVEENLALYYPLLQYFFVNKEDTELAERIEKGLRIAEEDGTFKELFLKYNGDDIERANLENRKMFVLENPDMIGVEIDTSWWLNNG